MITHGPEGCHAGPRAPLAAGQYPLRRAASAASEAKTGFWGPGGRRLPDRRAGSGALGVAYGGSSSWAVEEERAAAETARLASRGGQQVEDVGEARGGRVPGREGRVVEGPLDPDRGVVPGDGDLVSAGRRSRCTCTRGAPAPRGRRSRGRSPGESRAGGGSPRRDGRPPTGRTWAIPGGCPPPRRRPRPPPPAPACPGAARAGRAGPAACRGATASGCPARRGRAIPPSAYLRSCQVSRKKPRGSRWTSGSIRMTSGIRGRLELHPLTRSRPSRSRS